MSHILDIVDERANQKYLRELNVVVGEPAANKRTTAELHGSQSATAELSDSQLFSAEQCESTADKQPCELSDADLLDAERPEQSTQGGIRGCGMVGECERGAGRRGDAPTSNEASTCVDLSLTTPSGNNSTTPALPATTQSASPKQQTSASCKAGPSPKPLPKLFNFRWPKAKAPAPPAKPARPAYKRQLAIDETAPKSAPIDLNDPNLMWTNNKPPQLIRRPARATSRNNSDSAAPQPKRRRSGKQQHDSA